MPQEAATGKHATRYFRFHCVLDRCKDDTANAPMLPETAQSTRLPPEARHRIVAETPTRAQRHTFEAAAKPTRDEEMHFKNR